MNFSHHRSPAQSAREYFRGITGGLLFSIPLLYTEEVWGAGAALHPGRILLCVAGTFGILLLYNRFAGLRQNASVAEVAIDSIEEMGLGLVISAFVLWLIGEIDIGMGLPELAGKVALEAMTVAIGVSVGTAQLGAESEGEEGLSGEQGGEESSYAAETSVSLCGAVLFAANIAPTEEVQRIAAESPPLRILLLAGASLVAAAVVLHYAGMRGSEIPAKGEAEASRFLKIRAVVTTYATALAAAGACLYLFGSLDGQPWRIGLAMTVVTGVPAALGASAGRFLLTSTSHNSS